MPEAPVHNPVDWPHHHAWVRRLASPGHNQAHELAHEQYSIAYGRAEDGEMVKGDHSHYVPALVCAECGYEVPQDSSQWLSHYCPSCGARNKWPLDPALAARRRKALNPHTRFYQFQIMDKDRGSGV